MDSPSYQIFFSHSFHDDKDQNDKKNPRDNSGYLFLNDIKKKVEKENGQIRVIYDKLFKKGNIRENINRIIENSKLIFIFMNKKALSSDWVLTEFQQASTYEYHKKLSIHFIKLGGVNISDVETFCKKNKLRDTYETAIIEAEDYCNVDDPNSRKYQSAVNKIVNEILKLVKVLKQDDNYILKQEVKLRLKELLEYKTVNQYSEELEEIFGMSLYGLNHSYIDMTEALFQKGAVLFNKLIFKINHLPKSKKGTLEKLLMLIICKWACPEAYILRKKVLEKCLSAFFITYKKVTFRFVTDSYIHAAFPNYKCALIVHELNKYPLQEEVDRVKKLIIEKVFHGQYDNQTTITDAVDKIKSRQINPVHYILALNYECNEQKMIAIMSIIKKLCPPLIVFGIAKSDSDYNIPDSISLVKGSINYNYASEQLNNYKKSKDLIYFLNSNLD